MTERGQHIWQCVLYGVESWIGVLDWSHGVEYLSGFLEWNFGVKCWSVIETFILVVKLVSFERTPWRNM